MRHHVTKLRTTLLAAVLAAVVCVGLAAAAPGALDPSFAKSGFATIAVAPGSGDDFQNGLAVQRDGKIVVGGSSDLGASAGGGNWRLLRYKSNGELDSSFGNGGVVTTSMSTVGGDDEHIWRLALQRDGRIVAVGQAETSAGGVDWALARYNPNGTLDPTFGNGGKVIRAIGPGTGTDIAFRVLIDGSGRIVVGGRGQMSAADGGRNFALARYNPDGTLDASFNAGGATPGIVVTPMAPGARRDHLITMKIDGSGRIVAGGEADLGAGAGGFNFALARYNPDGSLDSTFDGDGKLTTAFAPGDNFDLINDMAIDGNGQIVVGGVANMGVGSGFFDWALARYNPDGSLDTTFGSGGKVTTHAGAGDSDDDLEGLVIQATGRIVVGGSTAPTEILVDSDSAIGRYNPDGSLDGTFVSGGIAVTPLAPGTNDDEIYDVALQGDGKIVAASECVMGSATGRDVCVARYKAGEAD